MCPVKRHTCVPRRLRVVLLGHSLQWRSLAPTTCRLTRAADSSHSIAAFRNFNARDMSPAPDSDIGLINNCSIFIKPPAAPDLFLTDVLLCQKSLHFQWLTARRHG